MHTTVSGLTSVVMSGSRHPTFVNAARQCGMVLDDTWSFVGTGPEDSHETGTDTRRYERVWYRFRRAEQLGQESRT
jgi:hypothetical protein